MSDHEKFDQGLEDGRRGMVSASDDHSYQYGRCQHRTKWTGSGYGWSRVSAPATISAVSVSRATWPI